jgi:hypothetical protein
MMGGGGNLGELKKQTKELKVEVQFLTVGHSRSQGNGSTTPRLKICISDN